MKLVVFASFISGCMLGFELLSDDGINHIIFDLLILRVDICWGAIEAFEAFERLDE
jgi:hypothetical protein